jgi:hypothetical protein
MEYRLERCPRCQLTPIEEYDLPSPFPSAGSAPVECKHCGARLWAAMVAAEETRPRLIVFRLENRE